MTARLVKIRRGISHLFHSQPPRNFNSQIHELQDYVHTTFVFERDLGSYEESSDTPLDSIVAPATISLSEEIQ
jgi:hypothetical protein